MDLSLESLVIDLNSRPGNWFNRSDLERTYGAPVVERALDAGLIEDVMADYVMLTQSGEIEAAFASAPDLPEQLDPREV